MNLSEVNHYSMICPHCQITLYSYHNVSKTKQPEIEFPFDNPVFSDGDTIPFKLHEFDFSLSWSTIDNSLLYGTCPNCHEDIYLIEVKLASKPIGDSDELNYWDDDMVNQGIQRLFTVYSPEPHMVLTYEQCEIKDFGTDNTTILDIEHHHVGPFKLNEEISGDEGVSQHYGHDTWNQGSRILSDILISRKDFLPTFIQK